MRITILLTAALTVAAATDVPGQTGNGAPSGAHYNLNIIGVSHQKNSNMDFSGGNVIFVGLGSRKDSDAVSTKILLSQSADGVFQVLDKNGTDGEASFSLPAPGSYTVWARALGTPGGKAKIKTCATDILLVDPAVICSTQNEVFVRGTGKSSFRNVTDALTSIVLDPVADSAAVIACGGTTVSLFDPCLQGFFWQYDNNGLRLLQVRFYPKPS
ncbi:MAG TPA: hypothetical protein VGU74_11765 [Gemmatimonadales bacterium]|nr:hypothetical protein [Gemmatimonadales bacterium]